MLLPHIPIHNYVYFRHPGDNPFYSNIDSMPEIRPIVRKPLGDFVSKDCFM